MSAFRRLLFLPLLSVSLSFPAYTAEKKNPGKTDLTTLPAQDFLALVRHAPSRETWSKLSGVAQHRRKGASVLKSKIRLGVRFTPSRIIGQLALDETEIYNLGQTFGNPPRSTRELLGRALKPKEAKLGVFGLSPDDLLLGFLYNEMLAEDPPERVSLYNCRVFVMKKNANGEFTRVFISTDYAFPLKVEWFKTNPADNPKARPCRTLEIASVKEKGDFVLVSRLSLYGPDWRTRIAFDELDAGYSSDSIPPGLFLQP